MDGGLIMGNIRLYGSTSGYTELAPPAVAPDGVLSLPSGVGTLLTAEGGKVLQVVRATDSTERTTTSTTYVDVTGMSITITPQKDTSAIILIVTAQIISQVSGNDPYGFLRITNSGGTAISGAENFLVGAQNQTTGGGISYEFNPTTVTAYNTPATLSSVTYKVQAKVDAGRTIIFSNSSFSTAQMYAIEVSA